VDCSSLSHHSLELGKSALGNAILGQKRFVAKLSMKSETSKCRSGQREFGGRRLIVIDTPGLFDTHVDSKLVAKGIGEAVVKSDPGPHCFIITISARNRFTEEAQKTIDLLSGIFGGDVLEYCIVVFTNEDAITDNDMTFKQWLPEQTGQLPSLANLINRCGRRCMAFNSYSKSASEVDGKVRQLVSMIDGMVAQNNGRIYTNDMYKKAEAAAREREEKIRREADENDTKIQRKIEHVSIVLMKYLITIGYSSF
jgi:GTPase Era involved in 16S rRNA processing